MFDPARTVGPCCLLALLLVACSKEAPPAPPPAPVGVVVTAATTRDVPVYLESVAQTVAEDTVDIRARVAGVLLTAKFEEGKPVKKGDVLFTIDPKEYEAALLGAKAKLAKAEADLKLAKEQVTVRTAEAQVAQAKARLKKAEMDVARLTPLAAADAVPKQDLDNAEAAQDVATADLAAADSTLVNAKLLEQVAVLLATAEVEGAKAAVSDAELNLGYCTITTPIDGTIGRREVSVGNLVGRGESTLLATVSTIEPMRAQCTISEQEWIWLKRQGKDKEGDKREPFHLKLADGTDYPHDGALVVAEREVDPKTGTLLVEAAFPNPDGLLKPGQFGRIKVVAERIKDAVVIPQRAIMEQQSVKIVYVVKEDNTVDLRPVTLGQRDGTDVVVKEGVKAGEHVIVEGMMKVRPKQTVVPTDEATVKAQEKDKKRTEGEGK